MDEDNVLLAVAGDQDIIRNTATAELPRREGRNRKWIGGIEGDLVNEERGLGREVVTLGYSYGRHKSSLLALSCGRTIPLPRQRAI